MASRKTWIGGAGAVAVALFAGTWFLGISPALSARADVVSQREAVEAQNQTMQDKLDALVADAPNLPQYQAELAELRVGIPTDSGVPDYLRRLDELAVAQGVTLTSVTPGSATPVVPSTAQLGSEPAAAPTQGATDGATPAPTADPTADAAAAAEEDAANAALSQALGELAAQLDGFEAVPISMTIIGNFGGTTGFLAGLQDSGARLMLVTDVTVTGQPAQDASDGRPATQEGDAEVVVNGFLFVLADPLAAIEDGADDVAPPLTGVPGDSPLAGGAAGA